MGCTLQHVVKNAEPNNSNLVNVIDGMDRMGVRMFSARSFVSVFHKQGSRKSVECSVKK